MLSGGPFSKIVQTLPRRAIASRRTSCEAGSTRNEASSRKALSGERFDRQTWTGRRGNGKRTDSWNERRTERASSVVSHSP